MYLRLARDVGELCHQKPPFGKARENKRPLGHQLLYLVLPAVTTPTLAPRDTDKCHPRPPLTGACVGSMFQ